MTVLKEQEILTKAYEAFDARDIDTVLTYMHPDVDWANGMDGGRVHRHEGVRQYWQRQWSLIDPHVEPTGFHVDEDGKVIADVHQVVRDLAGTILSDTIVQHVYVFRDGLITRMDIRNQA
jgi:ketosteroid isomerase-like protein